MDILNTKINHANNAHINVLLVPKTQTFVSNAPKEESMNHIVTVQPDSSITIKTIQNVMIVMSNAQPVLILLKTVLNVPETESTQPNVVANLPTAKSVNHPAHLVNHSAQNVKKQLNIVLNVLELELINHNVSAQPITTVTRNMNASNVNTGAEIVNKRKITAQPAQLNLTDQNFHVNATMDTLIVGLLFVENVPSNVTVVSKKPTTVSNVPESESKPQAVTVHPATSTTDPVNAKNVLTNVKIVPKMPKTALVVLLIELMYQNVLVKQDFSMKLNNLNVLNVQTDVLPVLPVDSVPVVKLLE